MEYQVSSREGVDLQGLRIGRRRGLVILALLHQQAQEEAPLGRLGPVAGKLHRRPDVAHPGLVAGLDETILGQPPERAGDVHLIAPHLQDAHEHPLGVLDGDALAVGKNEESAVTLLADPVHRFSLSDMEPFLWAAAPAA